MNKRHHIYLLPAFLLGVLAMVLSGCEDDMVTTRAISFGSHISSTRAESDAEGLAVLKNKGIGVYGEKTYTGETPNLLFENQAVTYNSTSSATDTKWEYSPIKYWDMSADASYNFGAYGPYKSSGVTYSEGSFTISGIPQWQKVDENAFDLMVADNRNGSYSTFDNEIVNLDFKHKLAKIIIRASVDAEGTTSDYQITKVVLGSNESETSGDLYHHDAKVPTSGSRTYTRNIRTQSDVFDAATMGTSFDFFSGESAKLAMNNATTQAAGTNFTTVASQLVAPFNVNTYVEDGTTKKYTIPIQVTYKDNSNTYGPSTVATELADILPGYVYTLNLKIGATTVTVSVSEIQDWAAAENVDNDVYNW